MQQKQEYSQTNVTNAPPPQGAQGPHQRMPNAPPGFSQQFCYQAAPPTQQFFPQPPFLFNNTQQFNYANYAQQPYGGGGYPPNDYQAQPFMQPMPFQGYQSFGPAYAPPYQAPFAHTLPQAQPVLLPQQPKSWPLKIQDPVTLATIDLGENSKDQPTGKEDKKRDEQKAKSEGFMAQVHHKTNEQEIKKSEGEIKKSEETAAKCGEVTTQSGDATTKSVEEVEEREIGPPSLIYDREFFSSLKTNSAYTPSFREMDREALQEQSSSPPGQRAHRYVGSSSMGSRPADTWRPAQITPRLSLDRKQTALAEPEVKLKKTATAWKSRRDEAKETAVNPEEERIQKLKKTIRGLLNKVTPTTFSELKQEFLDHKLFSDALILEPIVELIFDKAVEEPTFCPIYTELCVEQHEAEKQEVQTELFRKGIIKRCQTAFVGRFEEDTKEVSGEMQSENIDEDKKKELAEKLEQLKSKEKRRIKGTILLISQLYLRDIISGVVISHCVGKLNERFMMTADEEYVEYAVKMLETVGEKMDMEKRIFEQNLALSKDKNWREIIEIPIELKIYEISISTIHATRSTLSSRLQVLIANLEDLRRSGWKSAESNKGPKTIEQIHQEHEEECIKNAEERSLYLQQRSEKRRMEQRGGGPYKKQPNVYQTVPAVHRYQGRHSAGQPFGNRERGRSPVLPNQVPPSLRQSRNGPPISRNASPATKRSNACVAAQSVISSERKDTTPLNSNLTPLGEKRPIRLGKDSWRSTISGQEAGKGVRKPDKGADQSTKAPIEEATDELLEESKKPQDNEKRLEFGAEEKETE